MKKVTPSIDTLLPRVTIATVRATLRETATPASQPLIPTGPIFSLRLLLPTPFLQLQAIPWQATVLTPEQAPKILLTSLILPRQTQNRPDRTSLHIIYIREPAEPERKFQREHLPVA